MIFYCVEDYPEKKDKFVLDILTNDSAVYSIQKIIKTADIYLKYSNEGKIYFNSRKARDFFAEYLEDNFFMTFCGYEGRNNNCYFCGGISIIKYSDSRFKTKPILLCFDCHSKLTRLLK